MPFNTELVGSTVEMLVLKLLAERAMYGYEIIQVVNERTEGAFNWKEGTLYPVLHRLENKGFLAVEWQLGDTGKKRKYYQLTQKGAVHAREKVAEWHTFAQSVNSVLCAPAV
ncbi:MAG TPA: helix-turn-helix transcriptional regulator [Armatimonadota bacterium]|jgi:DNA-binding PadR family transcriptional regulator